MKSYEKLKGIYNIRLYESDHVNVLLGWVPIPLSNDRIKVCIKEVFGKLEANPIPSYIYIDGFELYVTYPGQESTCKYCGEPGHLQLDCEKRLSDFPQLTQNLDKRREKRSLQQQPVEKKSEQVRHGEVVENFQQARLDSPINLSKRRKLVSDCERDKNENSKRTLTVNSSAPLEDVSVQHDKQQITSNSTYVTEHSSQHDDMQFTEFSAELQDQNASNSNWWQMSCQLPCLFCKCENLVADTATKFSCNDCGEEQYIA